MWKQKLIIRSRIGLGGDRNETFNPIINGNKLTQKEYKTGHDWVGKVID